MNRIINKIPDWLRWLLLLPAIALYFLASALIMKGFLEFIGITQAYWGVYTICNVVSLFFVSGFIVLIAAYIAPKGKLLVSFIFAALLFLFFVFMAIYQSYINILSLICVLGPIAGFIAVKMNMCSKLYREILNLKERMAAVKRAPVFWAGCILLWIAAAGGIFMCIDNNTGKNGTLYVNGREVTSENVKIYSNYADLPFTEILKALDINVEWVDNSTAEFSCNGKKYTLNLAEVTLKRDGSDFNGLIAAPGSTLVHRIVLEKEIVLDSNLILDNMHAMGNSLKISIDHQKMIVFLTERKD